MDNHGEKTIIHTLRDALPHFAVKSKKLASPLLEPFGWASQPASVDDDELTALKSKLRRIRATLHDAESLSVTDRSVQLWLAELGDLEHRAEDVVEELEYESRRSAQLEELKQDLLYAATTGKRRQEVALLLAPAPTRRLRAQDRWHLGKEFDVVSVTRKIVEAVTRTRPECSELSTLHELIVEHLAGKGCLIVLDDVWDDNPNHWNSLTTPSHCVPGSTAAMTTRNNKVARMGFAFDKDLLVQLWTAQGFVDAEGDCSLEATANGYFNDLVSRCFFHPSPSHAISEGKYVMHDLYQELAQFVSGNECRMIQLPNSMKIDESPRHLSFVDEESHSVQEINLDSFCGHRDLQTFLFIARTEQNHEEMAFRTKIPSELITDFECLRALDLSNSNIMELPKSIGSLIHLRFLGLDNTAIKMLPESICALFHLQIIKLNHCSSLTQLPQGINLLLNLRCLEIPHSDIKMPSGIGELIRLQRLPFLSLGMSLLDVAWQT
ncbi:unnamed protein product [Miscanthus lutarioriparius]|uniref:Uncharacterized protein n=1 Tax=Miscanthus lutarioriparius TaxID=422564 RepID=A0A811NG00_9POAL|nr:unnamed protein product [Miscanthus lutarioriparius]